MTNKTIGIIATINSLIKLIKIPRIIPSNNPLIAISKKLISSMLSGVLNARLINFFTLSMPHYLRCISCNIALGKRVFIA